MLHCTVLWHQIYALHCYCTMPLNWTATAQCHYTGFRQGTAVTSTKWLKLIRAGSHLSIMELRVLNPNTKGPFMVSHYPVSSQ